MRSIYANDRRQWAYDWYKVKIEMSMEDVLKAVLKHCPVARIELFAPLIQATCDEFSIDTPERQAMFLAQISHESGELNYTEEIASGKAYEGRADLGNTEPGDGMRFKGRGLIQLTGHDNYEKFSDYAGYDFISDPKALATPEYAVQVSGWFWSTRALNVLADRNDYSSFRLVTRRINGGVNGFDDRLAYWNKFKKALMVED